MIYMMDRGGHLACTYNEDMAHILEQDGYRRISRQEYERRVDRCGRTREDRESDGGTVRG